MSKVLISSLIDEINSLLSRPVGSMSRRVSPDMIHQRDQLKQLRSHLESLTDDLHLGNLDKQYKALVLRLQSQSQANSEQSPNLTSQTEKNTTDSREEKSKTDKLETLPNQLVSQVVSKSFGAENDSIMETSTMTNGTPESNSTFVNDRMIAALQQAIQQTLQQVVKESVQQSVQQVVSQTLAVERALMVGEISSSLSKIVEAQQRSQISQELITLNQQKQKLNDEILQLESDRLTWMRQFQDFQNTQQEVIARSLQPLSNDLQEQVQEKSGSIPKQPLLQSIPNNLVNLAPETNNPFELPPNEDEFTNRVQEQTDRFLLQLDEMFSSTFRSLEQDIQGYQSSIEAKLGHMESLEQKGEALISALVDRISQQSEISSESTSQETHRPKEAINAVPEFPDDIPARYLETVAEPADENLINSLLAGNEFGEEIPASIVEMSAEIVNDVTPIIETPVISAVIATNPEDVFDNNLDLSTDWSDEDVFDDQNNPLLINEQSSEQAIEANVSDIESILGASSDTLFEIPSTTIAEQESQVNLDDDLNVNIDEDHRNALAALELNPDFDFKAITQIVESFGTERSEIDENDLQPLAFPQNMVSNNEEIDDPELLQWLEETDNRPSPSNIAEISPDEDLMSWLGNEALDMAKLPTIEKPPAQIITNSMSDLVTFTPPTTISTKSIETNLGSNPQTKPEALIEATIEPFTYNPLSDQAEDSDESLILYTSKSQANYEFPEWEDSLVDALNLDLESLDAGSIDDTAESIDQFIRNTPYAITNWDSQESQTYPTIIDISSKQANSGDINPIETDTLEIPPIIENPNALFIDQFAESFEDGSKSSLGENKSNITDVDLESFPFNVQSNNKPEIFDNAKFLFDSNNENKLEIGDSSNESSSSDDMDDIFAEVIAETAAKHTQPTPFEPPDELDGLFLNTAEIPKANINLVVNSATGLANENELDTLLFGFDPETEVEHVFNNLGNSNPTSNPSVSQKELVDDSFDTVMQGLNLEKYDEIDLVTDTAVYINDKSIESIEEELDTILQGVAHQDLLNPIYNYEATEFVEIGESATIIEDPSIPIGVTTNDWEKDLEALEAELIQPIASSNKRQTSELSADEFFASLEYDKTNIASDKSINTDNPIASIYNPSGMVSLIDDDLDLDLETSLVEDDAEDELLNDFADAQNNDLENEWDNLLNDVNTFNFNEPLLDDRREQLGLSSVAPITDTSENVLDIDSLVMESHSNSLIPSEPEKEVYSLDDDWVLGVDFGSTAIRASLLNANTGKVYPLYIDDADELPCKLVWTVDQSLDDPISRDIRVLTKKSLNVGLENGEIAISQFKQFLKIGLPYRGVSAWQPIIQWTDNHQASLRWIIAALKNLLEQIQTRANHPKLPDIGLILLKLSGVVFGYPSDWSDTYILNVREAFLKAKLVNQAEQVMALDQAIAPVLSLLHDQKMSQDLTLLIDAGAVTTSLCVAKGINSTKALDGSKLHIRSLDYAGIGISQDIIVQLFYPHWQLITNPNRHLCNFDRLSLPEIGASAPQQRILLQQYLLTSNIGQQMIALADRVKVIFGRDTTAESWNEDLEGQPIVVLRRELENLILQPFIQRLNRELNTILSNTGILGEDVRQVLLLGSTIHIPLLSRWLAQKLPNASINPLATSAVANGLAVSPLYPNLQDLARQQYSDYFLLQEICRLNLTKSINPTQLLQQLQMRGVNIKACRDRILSILQGDLPDGLFPWQEPEQVVILEDPTLSNELFTGRLFELETDGTYQPNTTKFQLLRIYLQAIIGNMTQTLNEPLVFPEIKRLAP